MHPHYWHPFIYILFCNLKFRPNATKAVSSALRNEDGGLVARADQYGTWLDRDSRHIAGGNGILFENGCLRPWFGIGIR